jgi:hypothetical protein
LHHVCGFPAGGLAQPARTRTSAPLPEQARCLGCHRLVVGCLSLTAGPQPVNGYAARGGRRLDHQTHSRLMSPAPC